MESAVRTTSIEIISGRIWCFLAGILFTVFAAPLSADWKDDIGYNQLLAEQGAGLADGTGVKVSMVEADSPNDDVGTTYRPDASDPQFSGKTLTDKSGTSTGDSSHATGVAKTFFGNTDSVAGGVTQVSVYEATDFLNNVLNVVAGGAPTQPDYQVQNHSYVLGSGGDILDAHKRLDYVADTYDVTTVVALNNNNQGSLPAGIAQGYNTISVGRSDGMHSYDTTDIYGAGRTKPDIVAPGGTTSNATPMVSSVATMLHQVGSGINTNATRSETIKAIIMAGATKDDLPGTWTHTNSQPLDTVYGAGELNAYNSFHIMNGGELHGSTTKGGAKVALQGWDYNPAIDANAPVYYDFNVATGQTLAELSILLTWHIDVVPEGDWASAVATLSDLNLTLYDSLNDPIDFSNSSVDNVEHLYVKNLAEGDYYFEITAGSSTDYAVAWRATAVPEPNAFYLLLAIGGIIGVTAYARQRRSQG